MKNLNRMAVLILLSVVVAACSKEAPSPQSAAAPAESTANEPEAAVTEAGGVTSGLEGTSWQLVQIVSMDDTTLEPDNRSDYRLAFGADGAANLVADCNRASGSWTSESEGKLEFGLMAATMAMCPPGSLHDQYLAQFPFVRSYVLKEGHLFLATMADGAIIEFEPADD